MKNILKLMTLAAVATLFAISCGKKEDTPATPEKPVVTADMFSVTANAETGDVVFKFLPTDLSPFWTVIDPSNNQTTFTEREVTKTYKAKGNYKGNIIAYGNGGQSDPVEFTFSIGSTAPVDPTLSATENILISETWKIRKYGWYGGEGENYWDYFELVPSQAAGIRMTFKKGGALVLNLGGATVVYNDAVTGGWQDAPAVSGNEKWAYAKEGDLEYVQFSDGGFPGMLGGDEAVNGKYLISDLAADTFMLCWQQTEEQWFAVILVPDYFEEPAPEAVSEEAANAALSGKTFQVSDYGWWGEGWQYFSVADGEEDLPVILANDFVTFGADGSLTLSFGVDDPLEEGGEPAARVYNDGVANGELYTVTGSPKWAVVTDGDAVKVSFSGGGFPLMIAGIGNPGDATYHYGIDGKWTVASIGEDGTVRLEIYQDFNEQWFTTFLTPVK